MRVEIKSLSLVWLLLIAISAINCKQPKENKTKVGVTATSVLDVPFKSIQIENTSYQIKADQDTVLFYKTGSKIMIPKNAFLDKEGNVVKGSVLINYREFTNAFDIYLGGIPMVYDSAGVAQVFETAGMLEINASASEQPVFPNPKNKIKIEMNSFQKGNKYNVYELNTKTGKWNHLGKDKVVTDTYEKSIAALPKIPVAPKVAGQFSFSIADYTGNYPEINSYENVLFEPVDNKYCGFNGNGIKINDLANGVYEVIFILDAYGVYKEEKCKCYLAFKAGADYDRAMKVYQKKYKSLINKQAKMKLKIEKQWKAYNEVKAKYADLGLLDLFNQKEITNLNGEEKITRTLQVSGFGFINCDYPTAYPQGAVLLASYKDAKGNNLTLKNVVLVEKGRNAIFRYTDSIKFNPAQENMLWGVTNDGKLAYLKASDFKKINQTTGNFTFTMNVHGKTLKTYEEICKVLF